MMLIHAVFFHYLAQVTNHPHIDINRGLLSLTTPMVEVNYIHLNINIKPHPFTWAPLIPSPLSIPTSLYRYQWITVTQKLWKLLPEQYQTVFHTASISHDPLYYTYIVHMIQNGSIRPNLKYWYNAPCLISYQRKCNKAVNTSPWNTCHCLVWFPLSQKQLDNDVSSYLLKCTPSL